MLLLVACSEGKHSPPMDTDNSGGSGAIDSNQSGGSDGSDGFQPVTRAQPTESGAWVVDPGDPLTLYALGERSMRSRDGGHTWAELDWPAGAESLAIAQQPVSAVYLRARGTLGAGSERLFESKDGGDSWVDLNPAPPSVDLVLVDQDDGPVLLGSRDGRIVRSTDGGSTWVASVLPPELAVPWLSLGPLIVARGTSPIVYAQATASDSLVLVSTDAGATFVAKVWPSTSPQGLLSLDCRGRLYFLDGTTVYRSSDAGTSWEQAAELEEAYNFRVLQGPSEACGDSVYASGEGNTGAAKLWRLDDSVVTSRPLPDNGDLVDLGDDRLLLVSTFGLRQRSDDGGRRWWTAGVNLGSGNLAISPTGAGSLFVATVGGVYNSDDGGSLWQRGPTNWSTPEDVYPDPFDVNVLHARSIFSENSPWSFVSTDRGASFQKWAVPDAAHPEIPEAIASTAPGALTVVTRGGVYSTNDAGGHFTGLLSLSAPQQVMWAAIGASDPPAIYAYVGGDDLAPDEIWASLDGGATWASSAPGIYITNLIVDPADPKIAFGLPGATSGDGDVLRTMDGGLTWERIPVDGEGYVSLHFDPQPPYALYAAGRHLQRSQDHGETWHKVMDLPTDQRQLELDPNAGGTRYVFGQRGLLYKMTE